MNKTKQTEQKEIGYTNHPITKKRMPGLNSASYDKERSQDVSDFNKPEEANQDDCLEEIYTKVLWM